MSIADFKKTGKKKRQKAEERVQLAVCNYLKTAYPNVIFFCDVASGLRLPIHIAALHKKMRSSKGLPDLFIAHPKYLYSAPALTRCNTLKEGSGELKIVYNGLFIELKKESLRLHNGRLPKNPHITEQQVILKQLRVLGFVAEICVGFDEAKNIIDYYLNQ